MDKDIKTKNELKIDLRKLIFDMLKELNERQKNVIVKRYDLKGEGVQTLDGIGKEYGITRERVRQIETESIDKLKGNIGKYNLETIFDFVKKIIEENGGLIGEDRLVEYL